MGVADSHKFLKEAFGAEQRDFLATPDGGIMHAEVKIGDSVVMMGEPSNASEIRDHYGFWITGRYTILKPPNVFWITGRYTILKPPKIWVTTGAPRALIPSAELTP